MKRIANVDAGDLTGKKWSRARQQAALQSARTGTGCQKVSIHLKLKTVDSAAPDLPMAKLQKLRDGIERTLLRTRDKVERAALRRHITRLEDRIAKLVNH